ncbi:MULTISPECIES: hypothetical protein [unclassified Flavobacterium]|uniref:hypothetical protein n=1 Tax=unclassified Flavobacterium TaxID=196869 RepID=UPI0018CC1A38|nr:MULTISPECIES: hypothetical protein [unclassified Flavobacterium]
MSTLSTDKIVLRFRKNNKQKGFDSIYLPFQHHRNEFYKKNKDTTYIPPLFDFELLRQGEKES